MTPEQASREAAAIAAEEAAQAQVSARLAAELTAVAAVLVAAQLRHASPEVLRTLVRRMLSEIVTAARTALEVARSRGLVLGWMNVVLDPTRDGSRDPGAEIPDPTLQDVIEQADARAGAHLDEAIALSLKLPMTDMADVMAVIAKAQGAVRSQRQSASWVTHRSIALGVAEVARERGMNVVWIAERDACLHCLAYQGWVVAPGRPFPPGLTYGDASLHQLGPILGPPLHPHCRCQLELTELEPGTVDTGLAREAARSVARGLSDFASEPARFRAADRLVKSATTLLPRSVIDRARRNVRDRRFKDRPRVGPAKPVAPKPLPVPAVKPPAKLVGRDAAEALRTDVLEQGPARAALLRYTGGEYSMINGYLRRGDPLPEDYRDVISGMEPLYRPAPFPMTVYRGVRPGTDLEGTDPAPISTSLSRAKAGQFGTVVAIEIPAGTPIIPVSQLQRGENYAWGGSGIEEEIILPPGTTLKLVNGVLTVVNRRRQT